MNAVKQVELIRPVLVLKRKMAEQVPVVFVGAVNEEVDELARNLMALLKVRSIEPIGWVSHFVLSGSRRTSNIVWWLVQKRDQLYFIERPGDNPDLLKQYQNTPQLFID